MESIEIRVQYWKNVNQLKRTDSGFSYFSDESVLDRTETWKGTEDAIFAKYYKENNSLKYCNGTYWKFEDATIFKKYSEEFFPKYHTIENYYGGGVVD
jgi:hypothetical protein